MAATFQATGTPQGGIANITCAWPAHSVGDIGLLLVEAAGGQTIALGTPAGFSEMPSSPVINGSGTGGTRLAMYWARATSTTMSSPVVTDPGNHAYGVIITFRNCRASGNPWTNINTATKAAASTTHTATGIATVIPNELVVVVFSGDTSSAAWLTSMSCSDLSSITERFDNGTASGNAGCLALYTGTCAIPKTIAAPTAVMASNISNSYTFGLRGTEDFSRGWQIS